MFRLFTAFRFACVGFLILINCLTVNVLMAQSPAAVRWEKELARQTDSTRKGEILLYIAKEYEVTDPNSALIYAQRSFDLGERLKLPRVLGLASLELAKLHTALGNKAKARRFRKRAEENLKNVDLTAELTKLEAQKLQAEEAAQAQQLAAAAQQQRVAELNTETERRAAELTEKQAQLTRQTKVIGSKDALIGAKDSLIGSKDQVIGRQDSVLTRRDLELRFQTDQIKFLEQEKALKAAEAEQERTVKNALIVGALLLLALAALLWRLIANTRRANQTLARKNDELDKARRRSDELLLNILPEELVNELKISGITQTRHHDEVTIMFTDFKDFTRISETLSPTELVKEIDHCFRHFDGIIAKYPSIEKIKTIGDAYLCAGGLPNAHPTHAIDVVAAALEIRDFISQRQLERATDNKQAFHVRIGVHTGPVVAGVVGMTKFAYDIWGDTVNTASRFESACEPGRVNISEVTHDRIKPHFTCRYRGKIATKNKDEMAMYYVDAPLVLSLN
jgi:adenylate cyclase